MDVKTYHMAVMNCDDKNEEEYSQLDDRIKVLEDSVTKSKVLFSDSFINTQYIDTLKTTATIEQGTIKMPGYNRTKVEYDFDDFYEVNFDESYDIDLYREKIVIRENALEGYLVTKWQDIPASTELDVSLIYDIASRIRNTNVFSEQKNLVYLYSDDYDDYTYIFRLEHTRSNSDYLTPKLTIEKIEPGGELNYENRKESYPLGSDINSSGYEFIPVSGLSVTRNYNGDLLLGFTVRNTKAIYGYGNRGSTYYTQDAYYNLHGYRGHYSSSSWYWSTANGSDTMFNRQQEGNAGVYCTLKVNPSNLSVSSTNLKKVNPHRHRYEDNYYDNYGYGSTVGLEIYGVPMYVETIRDGVVTTCSSYPKTKFTTYKYSSVNYVYNPGTWGSYFSFRNRYLSNAGNVEHPVSSFNQSEIMNLSTIQDTYSFAHDGVIYSLVVGYNTSTVNYNSILKTATNNYVFEKTFLLSKEFSTRKTTISAFKYIRSSGKLLSVTGDTTTSSNNSVILELHDIDTLSRTIATTGEDNNVKQVVDFADRYGVVISSHFTSYGHTGSYFALHEDHKNGLLHLVFPGRRLGEANTTCRLYHMNFDLNTLRPIGSPGEIAMTVATQSTWYNFQNVSIANNGKDIWVSYMFSDGRDHSDTYVVKVERFNGYIENRLQTDKGHNLRIDGFTQSFTFDEPIERVRFTSYLDNRIGVTHHNTTNVDHIEFVHNGSKDQNSEFYFESEPIPLNMDEGRVQIFVEQDEKDGRIDWFVSIDKGNTWEPYVPESWYRFYTNRDRYIKLKAVLSKGDAEYNEKFKSPFIRKYIMKVDSGVLQNDIVNLQINLMKTNFKVDSYTNATKNGLNRMSIDVFNDETNIDISRSDYVFDSTSKLVSGNYIVTKAEKINSTMTNLLLVVDEIDVDIRNTIDYYVSRDGGKSFLKVFPNVVTNIPEDGANDAVNDMLVFKAEFKGNAKLTAWAWSWD